MLASQAPASPKTTPGEGRGPFSYPASANPDVAVDLSMRNIFLQIQELDGRMGQDGMAQDGTDWDGMG